MTIIQSSRSNADKIADGIIAVVGVSAKYYDDNMKMVMVHFPNREDAISSTPAFAETIKKAGKQTAQYKNGMRALAAIFCELNNPLTTHYQHAQQEGTLSFLEKTW